MLEIEFDAGEFTLLREELGVNTAKEILTKEFLTTQLELVKKTGDVSKLCDIVEYIMKGVKFNG